MGYICDYFWANWLSGKKAGCSPPASEGRALTLQCKILRLADDNLGPDKEEN